MGRCSGMLVWLMVVSAGVSGTTSMWAQTPATDVPDFTSVSPQSLGVAPVKPQTDPVTGFVVGGRNATEVVSRLSEIAGRSIAALEQDMRPGAESDAGFLGRTESLLQVLTADNRYVVEQQQLTHQTLALHLRVLAAIGEKQEGREFTYHGRRYRVQLMYSRGFQESPFQDGTRTNVDVVIENLTNGQRLAFSLLVPLMMERYGFYEGRGTPYRVEPAGILRVCDFLRPAGP